MGKYLFIGCALIFCLGIFRSSGTTRLIWFFTGMIFFQDRIILLESPTIVNFHRLLIYTLFLAEVITSKHFFKELRKFPLIIPLFLVLAGVFFVGVFDSRNSIFLNLYRIIDDYIQSFFIIVLCYVSFNRDKDYKKLFNFFLVSSFILCLYGFYIFITKNNPYDNFITNLYFSPSYFDEYALSPWEQRFRVNSFVSHPIYYGYLVGVLLLLSFYCFLFEEKHKKLTLVVMGMLFLNLILSNSRTPLVATVLGILFFIFFALNTKMKVQVSISVVFIFLAAYTIPLIQEKIDNTIDIFETGGNKVSGSSVEMRATQFNASFVEFEKSPFFGNGFKYISENLGFENSEDYNVEESDFAGFESYIYLLLIEQGLAGILTNFIFFISILFYFLSKRKLSIRFSGMGIALLIMFLMFSFSTGTLGSWPITMGLLGILISFLNNPYSSLSEINNITVHQDGKLKYPA